MKLRRTFCSALFAVSALAITLLAPDYSAAQPPPGGGGFGKGGFGKGGFGKDGGGAPPGGGFGGKGGFGRDGGGGPPGGGFGGGGKNPFTDPDTVFNFYSKGGDVIDFSRMDPNMKAFARRGFEKAGLPPPTDTTVITRAQFTDSFTRALSAKGITPGGSPTPAPGGTVTMSFGNGGGDRDRDRSRNFGPPPGGNFGPPPGGGFSSQSNSWGSRDKDTNVGLEREKMSGPTTFRMTDQDIERRFAESDVNKDGKLSPDEVSDRSPLKASFQESDTSKDGYIDLNEYKAYIAVRFGGEGSDPNAGSYGSYAGNGNYGRDGRDPRGEKKEELPVAIRFGKLPTGLPSWWETLDIDKDGQVGLYEWRQDGRDMKEFQSMDLDSDGVIAPQEWFRSNTLKAEQAKAIAAEEEIGGSSTAPRSGGSSRPSFGSSGSFGNGGGKSGGGWPPSGGTSGRDSKSSERESNKDAKNPFRSGGKK